MALPVLTPAEITKYQGLLTEAESTYHRLLMGGGVRDFTDQNGERVAYSTTNRASLLAYINSLRALLGLPPFMGGYSARPAGIYL